jgi:hypothetical protein
VVILRKITFTVCLIVSADSIEWRWQVVQEIKLKSSQKLLLEYFPLRTASSKSGASEDAARKASDRIPICQAPICCPRLKLNNSSDRFRPMFLVYF